MNEKTIQRLFDCEAVIMQPSFKIDVAKIGSGCLDVDLYYNHKTIYIVPRKTHVRLQYG